MYVVAHKPQLCLAIIQREEEKVGFNPQYAYLRYTLYDFHSLVFYLCILKLIRMFTWSLVCTLSNILFSYHLRKKSFLDLYHFV